MNDVIAKKFTIAISSLDEFLVLQHMYTSEKFVDCIVIYITD